VPRTTELVVKLVATAAIDAEVLAPEGTPSDRAFVKAVPVPGGERIGEYTGASGKARLEKLKPGAWRVWAEDADGRSSESVVVQVQVGKPAVARLKLRP
jgi:hypothetical protein